MDDFYRGLETSLLGFGLVLGLAATLLVAVSRGHAVGALAITLPMIEVRADR